RCHGSRYERRIFPRDRAHRETLPTRARTTARRAAAEAQAAEAGSVSHEVHKNARKRARKNAVGWKPALHCQEDVRNLAAATLAAIDRPGFGGFLCDRRRDENEFGLRAASHGNPNGVRERNQDSCVLWWKAAARWNRPPGRSRPIFEQEISCDQRIDEH